MLRGRELERLDFAGYPEYVVVNEAFADQRWPGADPLGKRLMQEGNPPEGDVWYTVSGVVGNLRESSLMSPPEPTIYLPTVFKPDDGYSMFVRNMPVVIRTSGDAASAFPAIERAIRSFSPEIPINSVMTLSAIEARSFQRVSFVTALVMTASCVALLLCGIGIYGVVAYLVSLRSREFGIRVALGAAPRHVRSAVLREGGVIAFIGVAIGLAGAFALTRVIRSLLFGVAATDITTYAAATAGLLLVFLAASLGPARRATRLDPVEAIRME